MSSNPKMLNIREAAQMLLLFAKTNPCPGDDRFKFNASLTELLNGLEKYIGDVNISEAMWYKKATAPSVNFLLSPSWNQIDDTISCLGMLAFAIPVIGIPLSAGLDAIARLHENEENQNEYMRRIKENWRSSELQLVSSELQSLISEQEKQTMVDKVLTEVRFLNSYMADILLDPESVASAKQGFRATWVNLARKKEDVLGRDGLGRVWMLVESNDFQEFVDSPLLDRIAQLNLTEQPTSGMITISAYIPTISIVVAAIKLYAIVRLLPEEALHPGWNPSKFNQEEALKADWKVTSGDGESTRSARSCYQFLSDRLNPNNSISWLKRIDPQDPSKSDAILAYQNILNRLNRITYNHSDLPGFRDGYWFLPRDLETEAHPRDFKPSTVLRNHCTLGQHELKDTARNANPRDSFIEPFCGFHTDLKINWTAHYEDINTGDILGDMWGAFKEGASGRFAVDAAHCLILNRDYGLIRSPLPEPDSSSYDQISWYDTHNYYQDDPIRFDTIAWVGFVLNNYAVKLNFAIDIQAQMTTYTLARDVHAALVLVGNVANQILDKGVSLNS